MLHAGTQSGGCPSTGGCPSQAVAQCCRSSTPRPADGQHHAAGGGVHGAPPLPGRGGEGSGASSAWAANVLHVQLCQLVWHMSQLGTCPFCRQLGCDDDSRPLCPPECSRTTACWTCAPPPAPRPSSCWRRCTAVRRAASGPGLALRCKRAKGCITCCAMRRLQPCTCCCWL